MRKRSLPVVVYGECTDRDCPFAGKEYAVNSVSVGPHAYEMRRVECMECHTEPPLIRVDR